MSNASSPRQGGGGPSPSTQGQPVRYNPYSTWKNGYVAANGFRMASGQMIPSGMMAVANNGQLIMANQVQIANPAALQARLTNPYMGGVQMGGAQVMMGQMGGAQMIQGHAGQMMAGAQMLPNGQMVATGQMGAVQQMVAAGQPGQHHAMGTVMMQMPQVQYVQPPHIAGGQTGAGVAYQSQPVTYQNAQTPNTQPPPPPAGNPPKESDQQNALSRSSTPQTHPKSESKFEQNASVVPGSGPGGGTGVNGSGAPSAGQTLGPDFNELNERLQNANKEQRAEIAKLAKENAKMRDKVKKLSRENHAATKSYTVKDGKCPFCLQEMPNMKNKKT